VIGPTGDVVGVWLENPDNVADAALVDLLCARNRWRHMFGREFRRVPNTAGDRRGIYLMYFGYPAPCEPDPVPGAGPPHPTGRVVVIAIDDQPHAVHEDFDRFANAAAGDRLAGTALYRRRFDCLTPDHVRRLSAVLAGAFGENSREFAAVADSFFYCLNCFRPYSMAWMFSRDMVEKGMSSALPDLPHCIACDGRQLFWLYYPYRRRPPRMQMH
jgi:hypothetical protein